MLLQGKTKEYKNAASNLIDFCGKGSAVVQKKVEVSTTIENSSVFQSRTALSSQLLNTTLALKSPSPVKSAQVFLSKFHRFSWGSDLAGATEYFQYSKIDNSDLKWVNNGGKAWNCVCPWPNELVRPPALWPMKCTCRYRGLEFKCHFKEEWWRLRLDFPNCVETAKDKFKFLSKKKCHLIFNSTYEVCIHVPFSFCLISFSQ